MRGRMCEHPTDLKIIIFIRFIRVAYPIYIRDKMAQDQAQLLYNSIPLTNRGKLDSKVDAKHGGVQIHLGEIANSMDEWEGSVADALGLTNVDVANIKGRHRDKLSLQT